jgi:hypothetical protein
MINSIYIAATKSSLESCFGTLCFPEGAFKAISPFLYAIIAFSIISAFQAPYLPRIYMLGNVEVTLQHETTF